MYLKAAKIPPGPAPTRLWSECLGLPPGLRVPGITPRARDSLPMPQEDTDDAVTPPTAVSDCLGARAAKNRQQLKTGKGCIGQGVQIPLLAFF